MWTYNKMNEASNVCVGSRRSMLCGSWCAQYKFIEAEEAGFSHGISHQVKYCDLDKYVRNIPLRNWRRSIAMASDHWITNKITAASTMRLKCLYENLLWALGQKPPHIPLAKCITYLKFYGWTTPKRTSMESLNSWECNDEERSSSPHTRTLHIC